MSSGIYKRTKSNWKKGLKRKVGDLVDKRIVAFWEGKKRSKETIEKIRKTKTGTKLTEEHKAKLRGRTPWNKGEKSLQSAWNKGIKTGPNPSHSARMKGKKASIETRLKLSNCHKGEKSYLWRGGITPINRKIRTSFEYRLWRTAVFERDNYTCIWCGKRGVELNADHIKPFACYPELRFAIDNGRTLCKDCHKTTDSYLKHKISTWI